MTAMKLTKRQIELFQKKILDWWKDNRRDLPWRHTHDPYKIMISEVMLQQTQVSRVFTRYAEFIEAYPTVKDLAKASTSDVLKTWKGMGYNRRALYIKKAAQTVVDQYKRVFPKSEQELVKLPGLGKYTARAILVFAYGQEIPLVDTNIRQIITHFFLTNHPQGPALKGLKGRTLEKEVEDIARQLVPLGKSWEWHQALMDYGALRLARARSGQARSVRSQTPFKESNRFYRGRVIDRLREGEVSKNKLIADFQKEYGKSRIFLNTITTGLERDGLLTRFGRGVIGLPKE